uniref:Putative esterase n=1 Tax=termite gut metagenome TaxID=433724 RepID=S0DF61_9ZZZZ
MKKLLLPFCAALLLLPSCHGGASRGKTPCDGEITADSSHAIVKTTSGEVAGYIDQGIFTFKGIPYARAERFMPPTAPEPWTDVRSSRAYGPVAMQEARTGWWFDQTAFWFDWDDGFAGEDCLRVNVWSPGMENGKRRPVMVWLHGGGYSAGSSQELPSYDGTALAAKGDVVVVSINHRLNVLGFLDLSAFGDKYASSGNAGMLDIVAALRWVRTNIAAFGGDADNVTIFGQSGGGGKVSTLMAMPSAKGLFHKAIVQSGSLTTSMESQYSRRIGVATLEELGVGTTELDKLADIPYNTLIAAGNRAIARVRDEMMKNGGSSAFIFGWGPTVDGNILPAHPFSPTAPDMSRDVPMIIGTTVHEFLGSMANPALWNISLEGAKRELATRYGDNTDAFVEAFAKAYPDYTPRDFFDVDLRFRPMALRQAELKHAQGGAPVWMYLFTWESPVLDGMFRSMHCVELPFVFDNVARCRQMTGGGENALALADRMSSAWLAFARTGDPNTAALPQWEPYDPAKGATMRFDDRCEILYNHDRELLRITSGDDK